MKKKKPSVSMALGDAYKKLIKKDQWIMIECHDMLRRGAAVPKPGRWLTDDHCIDIREEEPENDYPGGYSLVVAKVWDHCEVLIDVKLEETVRVTNDCIIGDQFKIWIMEQRVVSGLLNKVKKKNRKR
jgi:hypothetical protein